LSLYSGVYLLAGYGHAYSDNRRTKDNTITGIVQIPLLLELRLSDFITIFSSVNTRLDINRKYANIDPSTGKNTRRDIYNNYDIAFTTQPLGIDVHPSHRLNFSFIPSFGSVGAFFSKMEIRYNF
jgi:hypothetical protein